MSRNEDFQELEKVRQLRIQYSHYYDTGDIDGIVSLFTEDAIVDAGVHGGAEGIDNVRDYFAEQRQATGQGVIVVLAEQLLLGLAAGLEVLLVLLVDLLDFRLKFGHLLGV